MHPSAGVEIQLFGHAGIRTGDGRVLSPPRAAVVRLLAVLAVEVGTPVSETDLLDRVWRGDSTREPAAGTLRRNIDWLRDSLTEAGGSRDWVTWDQRARSWTLAMDSRAVDYHRFLDEIDGACNDADWDRLQRALDPRQEKLLSNIDNRWAGGVRHQMSLRRRAAVKALFTHLLDTHRYDDLITLLGPCEDDVVPDENLLLLGAKALAAGGRHAEISSWAARIADRVRDELGAGRSATASAQLQRLIADPPGPAAYTATSPTATLGVPRAIADFIGVVDGGVHQHPSAAVQTPRQLRSPAELPGDIRDFTGRDQIADEVRQLLDHAGGTESTAVVISTITGMAGIGKTALAVHVAHHEREQFSDGQFYVNLRGAEAQALDPMTVLGDFLTKLGMVDLPGDLDGRARAYRTRVAGRRMLVVLDNAANEDQVRPLLPGSPSCAVLITSRVRLLNLAGAHMVLLDVLHTDEAVELLSRISGHERVAAERDPAEEIVRLCGQLPIAIRMAGAVLIKRPRQSLAQLAEQLRQERPLDVFSAEGSDDVRVSFSLSYRNLGPDEQRLFRLLGMLRAPDFPAWVGEVALDMAPSRGDRAVIDRLVDAQLLEDDHGQGDAAGQRRYHFHDLLREFAQEQLEATEPAPTTRQVMQHVFTRYLLFSQAASRLLRPVDDDASQPLLDSESASRRPLEWFLAEQVSLTAAVEQACESGFSTLAWKLALSLDAFFERSAQWDSWRHVCERALAATREAVDLEGEAQMLRSLGYLARERGRPREALEFLERSRDGFRIVGDQFGEARALCNMIRTYRDLGRFDDALECYRSALPITQSCGSQWLEASVHRDIGMAYRDHGNAEQALDCLEKALPLFRETGEELLEIYTVRDIGMVYQQLDRQADSESCFQQSLVGFERLGDRRGAARALNSLGVSHRAAHDWEDAATCFRRALEIFREIGDLRWEAYTLRSLGELSHDQAVAAGQCGLPITRWARRRGQLRDAEDMLRESRRILDELDDRPWEAQTLLSLGEVYCDQGRWDEAITCFTRCLTVFQTTGNSKGEADVRTRLDRAISLRDQRTRSPKGFPNER